MELKEFISAALTQIVEGAEQAQANVEKYGAAVNPGGYFSIEGEKNYVRYGGTHGSPMPLCNVHFDLNVTTSSNSNSSGGVRVLLGAVNIGGNETSRESSGTSNRISFNVSVLCPSHQPKTHE